MLDAWNSSEKPPKIPSSYRFAIVTLLSFGGVSWYNVYRLPVKPFSFASFSSGLSVFIMYSQEDLFSPLDGDVSLQTRFTFGSGKEGGVSESTPLSPVSILSPISLKDDSKYKSLRRHSVPRKSLPVYEQIQTHNESFSTMQADSVMEKDEQAIPVKRGWRFYGTFATLAVLNFICAIDATILAVALPVRDDPAYTVASILIIFADHCYRSESHGNSSLLGWDQFPLVTSLSNYDSLIKHSTHTITDARQSSSHLGHPFRTSSGASQSS